MGRAIEELRAERNPKVVVKRVGQDVLVFKMDTCELFSLNDTAAEILTLCAEPVTLRRIYDAIAARHKKGAPSVKRSVVDTIEKFVKAGIIRLSL